ncbi:MAG: peptide chain release factor N(5)-glutamine methyltransferase [Lachnospiraceae bacterium]|nr:peptide chain release factor N(5)-glutamine methyltransferase [Lachnospiraceae bacterium]
MTRREAYEYGVEQLEAEGIENADCDIRILLEDLCGVDREELFIQGDKVISRRETEIFMNAVNKRMGHYPVQYITGKQEFMGLTFTVNQNVLIPRMDTEILVEEVMRQLNDKSRILDMCTGSGCILLSLLYYSNDCEGVGVDISEEALDVAKDNAGRLILDDTFDLLFKTGGMGKKHLDEDKIEFIQSNLFNDVRGRFDIIVSNPPYIRSDVIPTLMEEVRDYEPILALDGKDDGLYFYRKIIEKSPDYLNPGGLLFFEIGYDQAHDVVALMEKAGFKDVTVVQDYAHLDRVVWGRI